MHAVHCLITRNGFVESEAHKKYNSVYQGAYLESVLYFENCFKNRKYKYRLHKFKYSNIYLFIESQHVQYVHNLSPRKTDLTRRGINSVRSSLAT